MAPISDQVMDLKRELSRNMIIIDFAPPSYRSSPGERNKIMLSLYHLMATTT